MNTRNLISIAAVVVGIMFVWMLAKKVMFYAIVAGVIYLIYTMFIAGSSATKKQ